MDSLLSCAVLRTYRVGGRRFPLRSRRARRRSRAPRARKWGHLQILYIYTTYTYTCIISVYSYVIYLYTLNYDLTGA